MEKKWVAPDIEVLDVSDTAHGWNAWKMDWEWVGLPLVGEKDPS